jgi:hypothetical protein
MGSVQAFLGGRSVADQGLDSNHTGLVGTVLRVLNGCTQIVQLSDDIHHLLDMPSVGLVPFLHVFGKGKASCA